MNEQYKNNTPQGLNQMKEKMTHVFFSLPEKNRKRLTRFISWGGTLTGLLASSTPVFADLKETTKSAGTDIFNYIAIAVIVLGVVMMAVATGFISTGGRKLTEEGQRRLFWAGAGVAGLFLIGLVVKFVMGTVSNGGGSLNPFSQLPF
ncbi:hypothetical protein [Fructobacillus fructosus]|uniref:Integral membrane protein n=1 Tax=Fructobacillus fructosus TaxID=1631 RepID=A0ABM9MZR3_9LACO|nr:hypothetical protein [Fructobacillus fructosus]MBC9119291.1 hypothetical protein [Fructobacillus fructosus]MBD9366953.1 hypothetical protein [Leuconostoc mesenteroides]CAK1237058.1 hypothetical protein R55210_AODCCCNP_00639 [Fructobacillus fructosus]CAK1251505.1 hypothetical protein R54839_PPFHFPJH_01392 [Fructobacillus fructosus]